MEIARILKDNILKVSSAYSGQIVLSVEIAIITYKLCIKNVYLVLLCLTALLTPKFDYNTLCSKL